MADLYVDVHLEIDPVALDRERDPLKAIHELSYAQAEAQVKGSGYRLRHALPVEVYSRPGLEKSSGRSVLLVATRWVVDGNN